jgi:hypothetical protein
MYAKTGTLFKTPATNLAGFVELKTGTLVFSVVGNELKEIWSRTTVRVNGKPVAKTVYNQEATLGKGRNLIEAMVRRYVGQAESLEANSNIKVPMFLFSELFH